MKRGGGTFVPHLLLKEDDFSLSMTKNRDDETEDDDFEVHDAKYAPVFVSSSSSSNNKDNDETRGGKNNHPILLGEGNFGQARLMMNKSTGEKVAIKYIPRGKHLDENVVR